MTTWDPVLDNPQPMTEIEEILKRFQQANEILYPCFDLLLKTGGVEYYKELRDIVEALEEFAYDVQALEEK